MARPQSIEDEPLLGCLAGVFRDAGYDGASLAVLSAATGLQKASLYHRFPRGKQQMAEEVLGSALGWVTEQVITPLLSDGPPARRITEVVSALDGYYDGGRKACLLNMLSRPQTADGPFAPAIRTAFQTLIAAFAKAAADAGLPAAEAHRRGARAVMLLQGSLVLSRGLGDDAPFRSFLAALPDDLLSPAAISKVPS